MKFRNIRRQLLQGHPIRKYFLYALGEIILIVVGVLTALQMDTWHQRRLDWLETQGYSATDFPAWLRLGSRRAQK